MTKYIQADNKQRAFVGENNQLGMRESERGRERETERERDGDNAVGLIGGF